MSVFGTKNLMNVFVGKDIAGTAIASITSDLLGTMADGQVIAVGVTVGGAEVVVPTTATPSTYPFFRLVEKQGGVLNYGPRIKTSDVIFAKQKTYVAPAEQTYYIGYNGTSGSLDVSQSNEFMLTIAYDHDDMMWSEQKLRNTYDYYSQAPTQQGLAASMVSQINYKENLGAINGTGRMVRAEMLSNGTLAAVSDGTQNQDAVVVQDSVSVKLVDTGTSTAGDLAGCQSALPAGTVVNIAGVKYIVQSVATVGSDTVMTLNTPYQGTSGTVTGGTTLGTEFSKVSAITSYGIKIRGEALTWVKDFFKFNKVKFHFDLKGFGETKYDKPGSLIAGSESTKGVGSPFEVAELESFAAGFEGALNRTVVPLPAGRTYTDTAKTYDVIVIESVDSSPTQSNGIIGNAGMRVQQFVCMPVSAANKTKLKSQLDALLAISL